MYCELISTAVILVSNIPSCHLVLTIIFKSIITAYFLYFNVYNTTIVVVQLLFRQSLYNGLTFGQLSAVRQICPQHVMVSAKPLFGALGIVDVLHLYECKPT